MAVGGPCAIFAPFVFLLFFLLLPFWPVAIVLVALAWCIVWPLEKLTNAVGSDVMAGWTAWMSYAVVVTCKPWVYFDSPEKRAARRARMGIADKPLDATQQDAQR